MSGALAATKQSDEEAEESIASARLKSRSNQTYKDSSMVQLRLQQGAT